MFHLLVIFYAQCYSYARWEMQNKSVVVDFWDTAGQERFSSMHPSYYHQAHACLLVSHLFLPVNQYTCRSWVFAVCDKKNTAWFRNFRNKPMRCDLWCSCYRNTRRLPGRWRPRGKKFCEDLQAVGVSWSEVEVIAADHVHCMLVKLAVRTRRTEW